MTEEDAQAIDVDWGKWWSRPLTQGEIGCTISHTEIWKRAMNYTLVLEDDVTFTLNWISKLKLAMKNLDIIDKDWDLLYLGRVPQEDNETKVHNNIVKPKFSFCTYAYMLSPKGIKKIQQYNVEKSIIPADEFLSATYVNHPREDVRLKYPPTLNAYAIEPQIVLQRSKSVAGSDTGLP
jgi:glycosyl transferase family 25